MGRLVDGVWKDEWYDTKESKGHFKRTTTTFRHAITKGGRFEPEPNRYHLVIADACPWCHRVALAREIFGLQDVISMHRVGPLMLEHGWEFETPDPVFGATKAHQFYTQAEPTYSGRVTVPILWDRKHGTLVNNESSEIIRMLDEAFRPLHTRSVAAWYPPELRTDIDALNAWIYSDVNNGVYKSGFATTQSAYDQHVAALFAALDRLEAHLEGRTFLVGEHATEADWRLFPTLIRFDAVYFGHFKCNVRRLVDYPRLQAYTERLASVPGVADVTDLASAKEHYYRSHTTINPTGVVPKGPELRFFK